MSSRAGDISRAVECVIYMVNVQWGNNITNYRDYYKCKSGDKIVETIYKLFEDDCNFLKYKF